jgi:predicted metalloprotease with PDZ domain
MAAVKLLAKAPTAGRAKTQRAALLFRVEAASLNAHLFRVTLTVPEPAAVQRVSLPVWIPGSYLVREFSKSLQELKARQGTTVLAVEQLDKNSWQFACDPQKPLVLTYQVYALDNSVRTAWLDSARGFFNGTSLFLRVHGHTDVQHSVQLVQPATCKTWQVATGLQAVKANRNGFGLYQASNYDELADCPVEMGDFWSGNFKACGILHRFVVAGALPSFDGVRLLADAQKICEEEIRFWHPEVGTSGRKAGRGGKPPFANYVFMLNAVDDGYGGLEHRNSTALICSRKDLPRTAQSDNASGRSARLSDGYTTLLGLISHEYFHTWNVKRLRPAEFAAYDYSAENYTQLLWFFEGFTSYYDDLLLRRANLVDDAGYLKLINKTVNQVMQAPGRLVQTVAEASFDAWVKYYRQDENTPNATVSYYTKGALVAMCLDLTLRLQGRTTLDDVMRALWVRCQGGTMVEADLAAVLQELSGRSFAAELRQWVHSTAELPLKTLLEDHGVAVHEDRAQLAQALGLRVAESGGVQVKTVLRGGAAEAAGFASGDEWLGIETGQGKQASAWRIHKLDEVPPIVGNASQVTAIVSRDKRLLRLPLALPQGVVTWRLAVRDAAKLKRWLGP